MWRDWGPLFHAFLLLLLARLPLPANGNTGSSTGSCHCDNVVSTPLSARQKEHIQKYLKDYQRCPHIVRFQLTLLTVCGKSNQPWVLELMNCFDHKECGIMRSQAHQMHLPLPNTQASEPTEQASSNIGTSAQTYLPSTLQSTQQPALPATALVLDRDLSYSSETVTSTIGHNLGAGPEAGETQKQLESSVGPQAGTSAIVPVLSLLGIVFILTGVLLYVLQKKRKQSKLYFSEPSSLQEVLQLNQCGKPK